MTVELWIGQEFDTTQERQALEQFMRDMNTRFGQTDQLYLVLANYYLSGRQIDFTVLKQNAIIVIELKQCIEPFRAVENGDWLTIPDGVRIGTGDQNPFAQVKDYRFKWMDLLNNRQNDFLPLGKGPSMNFKHVSAFVAISPSLHPDIQNQIPGHLPWFQLVGLDKLSIAVGHQTSSSLNFSDQELRILAADILNLTPTEISTKGRSSVLGESATTMDVNTPLLSEHRSIALNIINGMRTGVPPSEYVQLYTVGRDRLIVIDRPILYQA